MKAISSIAIHPSLSLLAVAGFHQEERYVSILDTGSWNSLSLPLEDSSNFQLTSTEVTFAVISFLVFIKNVFRLQIKD